MNNEKRNRWLNEKQQQFLTAPQRIKTWVGGRGTSKTTTSAVHAVQCLAAMPRGKGALIGLDIRQLKTKEIPPIFKMWEMMGYSEYHPKLNPAGQFVAFREPPAFWKRPFAPPKKFDNAISFWDGGCMELVSMFKKESSRGGSYDWAMVAEAAFVDQKRFYAEVFPMVRGYEGKYKSNLYLSWVFTTTMPYTSDGFWVPDMEELAKEFPDEYFYMNSTIYDNADFYGIEYIEQVRENITKFNPLIWDVEYMNKRSYRPANAFYSAFDESKHCYRNTEEGFDPYYDPDDSILLSFDFNGYFTCCTMHQLKGSRLTCQNEFFVKSSDLEKLIDMFCQTYLLHNNKFVKVYGDAWGNQKERGEKQSAYDKIQSRLSRNGWRNQLVVKWKQNPEHFLKHQVINEVLREESESSFILRVNQETCPNSLGSILAAPIANKYHKDKSSEKSKLILPERATHLSDTIDYVWYPVTHKSFKNMGLAPSVGTF